MKELNTPPTINEYIELAAQHLPVSREVVITIEKDGYGVKLISPEREEINADGGDGMRSDVVSGINIANGFA